MTIVEIIQGIEWQRHMKETAGKMGGGGGGGELQITERTQRIQYVRMN